MLKQTKTYLLAHKFISAVVLLVSIGGGWFIYAKMTATAAPTKYVLSTVQTGTIIAAITGSGQVSASDQITINPKVSGQIIAVYVKDGQRVSAGQALATIDSKSAQKAVRDAKANLESTKIALQKLRQPADALSTTQAENNLSSAEATLVKTYQDGYNDVTALYLDLPDIIVGLQDIVSGTGAARGQQSNIDYYKDQTVSYDTNAMTYHDDASNAYVAAQKAYASGLADYKTTSQSSSTSTIQSIAKKSYLTARSISDALKSTNSFLQFYSDQMKYHSMTINSTAASSLLNLNTYISKMNTHLTTLLSDIDGITTSEQNITEMTQTLQKLRAGADTLDVQSSELSVTQRQNALQDAEDALSDYTIRAPFAGMLANFNLHLGDSVGNSTAAATEISSGQIADLLLNEVDAAKVQTGQKATLTFDAIPDLSLTGHVASISPLGTVSQGVVSYNVKISLDAQDSRVKPGMTVNASIITAIKQNVLAVPTSAVKTQGGTAYVLVVDSTVATSSSSTGVTLATAPEQRTVVPGISSNTQTEIVSGLTAGETIVSRTISGTAAAGASATPSLIGGGPRGGGALR